MVGGAFFKEKKREWHLFVSGESIGGGEEQ